MNSKIKKIFLFIVMLGVVEASFSQDEKKPFIHKGILRATGTISPGIMLKQNVSTISLHGNLEYYINDNISFRGDVYYFLSGLDARQTIPFEFNHSIFSGASYHFKTKNHFDPYFAFEPGISLTKSSTVFGPYGSSMYTYPAVANPLISSVIGFNFYFQKWFHLFAETRYIYGKHSFEGGVISLSELRFSFGLGFNLGLIKPQN